MRFFFYYFLFGFFSFFFCFLIFMKAARLYLTQSKPNYFPYCQRSLFHHFLARLLPCTELFLILYPVPLSSSSSLPLSLFLSPISFYFFSFPSPFPSLPSFSSFLPPFFFIFLPCSSSSFKEKKIAESGEIGVE